MSDQQTHRIPAIDGWFQMSDDHPQLLGSQCCQCGSYFFPQQRSFCRRPSCTSQALKEVGLSRTGRLWSFTNNCYQPPAPYVSSSPFVPYAIAAVELTHERMVVLGQLATGIDLGDLKIGMQMELVIETLYEENDTNYMIWKWACEITGSSHDT